VSVFDIERGGKEKRTKRTKEETDEKKKTGHKGIPNPVRQQPAKCCTLELHEKGRIRPWAKASRQRDGTNSLKIDPTDEYHITSTNSVVFRKLWLDTNSCLQAR